MTYIDYEKRDGAAWVTMNRPEVRNALIPPMVDELHDALLAAKADPEVRSVVITGAGTAFCSGIDLKEAQEVISPIGNRKRLEAMYWRLEHTHRNLGKPTIALLNGPARAAGCTMAFMCDMLVATSAANFAMPEMDRGFLPAYAVAFFPRQMSRVKAFEYAFTGKMLPAAEAERLGLINSVYDSLEEATQEVTRLVEVFRSQSALAMDHGKEIFYRVLDMEFNKALRDTGDANALLISSGVTNEGIDAFVSGEKPNWS